MLRILCAAALVLAPVMVAHASPDDRYAHVTAPSSAKPKARKGVRRAVGHAHSTHTFAGGGLAATAARYVGTNPTGMRWRWCGAFLQVVVRQSGLPDHPGGNLARAWASYGRAAAPGAVGSIAVMRSHVGIVTGRCEDGRVQVLSGNHNRTTGYGCYSFERVIAWRAAG